MKKLSDIIQLNILPNSLFENNISILSDLDNEENNIDLQVKNINNKLSNTIGIDEATKLLNLAILYKDITPSNKFIRCINNPNNYTKYNALIQAKDERHLEKLINFALQKLNNGGRVNLNWIDVSNVHIMDYMLSYYNDRITFPTFDFDVSLWDMSNVTSCRKMFMGSQFNGDISKWDVSNVTNMERMFASSTFNNDISKWDVSNVQEFNGMFSNNEIFNQPIGNWNVASAKYMDSMFFNAQSFNQNISQWDVSNVVNMTCMFTNAMSFKQNISNWNIDNSKNAHYKMFTPGIMPAQYMPKFKHEDNNIDSILYRDGIKNQLKV